MSKLNRQPQNVPVVDPRSGQMTPAWYRVINDLIQRVGGLEARTNLELGAEVDNAQALASLMAMQSAVKPQPPSIDWQTLALGQALAPRTAQAGGINWETALAAGLIRRQLQAAQASGSGVSLAAYNTWTATQRVAPVVLTDAATINTDARASNNFRVTLGGNRTLANPTNLADGMKLNWVIVQDATGSRTLTFGSAFNWGGAGAPVLSTTANAIDMISAYYDATSGNLLATFRKGT